MATKAVKGIAQYNFLQGGIYQNFTTTPTDVPGMSFEMLPGKSYLVMVQARIFWHTAEGLVLRWANVTDPINANVVQSIFPSNVFNQGLQTTGVSVLFNGGSNDGGLFSQYGIFTNSSTTQKQTCQLNARQQNAGGGLGMGFATGTITAILIN